MRRPILLFFLVALTSALSTTFAQADRMLDPLTLPPAARFAAMHAPLGAYGPFGHPSAPGCYWSRIEVPTFEGLRWMLLETCTGTGSRAH